MQGTTQQVSISSAPSGAAVTVDAITGGMYKLTPEQVMAELEATGDPRHGSLHPDDLVVFVVLQPKDGWEPIASLDRE